MELPEEFALSRSLARSLALPFSLNHLLMGEKFLSRCFVACGSGAIAFAVRVNPAADEVMFVYISQ